MRPSYTHTDLVLGPAVWHILTHQQALGRLARHEISSTYQRRCKTEAAKDSSGHLNGLWFGVVTRIFLSREFIIASIGHQQF